VAHESTDVVPGGAILLEDRPLSGLVIWQTRTSDPSRTRAISSTDFNDARQALRRRRSSGETRAVALFRIAAGAHQARRVSHS